MLRAPTSYVLLMILFPILNMQLVTFEFVWKWNSFVKQCKHCYVSVSPRPDVSQWESWHKLLQVKYAPRLETTLKQTDNYHQMLRIVFLLVIKRICSDFEIYLLQVKYVPRLETTLKQTDNYHQMLRIIFVLAIKCICSNCVINLLQVKYVPSLKT